MHIGGEGNVEKLCAGVKAALAKTKEIRGQSSQPTETFGGPIPSASSISADALQQIFTAKPEAKDGMAKFVFGRVTKMPCGCEAGKEMGVNTWAAFAGSDDNAVVDGDFACQEQELQPVLRSLRKSHINIVAIHPHMTLEQPRYLFLHYWGRGKAADLANAVRLARGEQTKATAAAAREAGGFQEVDAAHFNKHRSDGATVIDVRSPEEFAKGHVPGALNFDINAAGFASKVLDLETHPRELPRRFARCDCGREVGRAWIQNSVQSRRRTRRLGKGRQQTRNRNCQMNHENDLVARARDPNVCDGR